MLDNNEQIDELQVEETETRKYNTRGQTRYIKQALIRIFRMKPEVRATYVPQNGWEEAAMAHFNRCLNDTRGTAALNALRESIGETIAKQKTEPEKKSMGFETVEDDLPKAVRKVQ